MPLILPANTLSGDYEIDNSLRFNSADTARLGKTISGTSNRKTFSLSCWLKKSHNDGNGGIMGVGTASSDTGKLNIRITGSDVLVMEGGATNYRITNRAFRDNSAWYNIFISFDSTQSTADNRISIYVNGVEETSFSTKNNPSQDANTPFNEDGKTHYIGTEGNGSSGALDGYLAEFHYIDGTRKAHSDFGEFNDNGIWIPKKYLGSYGTHGFYFQFLQSGTGTDASGMGADTSGNGNHYAINNLTATDQTTDTPTNNFATLTPHGHPFAKSTLTDGNLDYDTTGDSSDSARDLRQHCISNIGVTKGKWYAEFKITEDINAGFVGVSNWSNKLHTEEIESYSFVISNAGNYYYREKTGESESNGSHGGSSNSLNDIFMVALDADNKNVYFGKNGQWASGSGAWNQSSPSSARAYTQDFIDTDSHGVVVFNVCGAGSSETPRWQANFGNPIFTISSGNADDNGYGNFEYDVPTGYYALCTKNLAEFG